MNAKMEEMDDRLTALDDKFTALDGAVHAIQVELSYPDLSLENEDAVEPTRYLIAGRAFTEAIESHVVRLTFLNAPESRPTNARLSDALAYVKNAPPGLPVDLPNFVRALQALRECSNAAAHQPYPANWMNRITLRSLAHFWLTTARALHLLDADGFVALTENAIGARFEADQLPPNVRNLLDTPAGGPKKRGRTTEPTDEEAPAAHRPLTRSQSRH